MLKDEIANCCKALKLGCSIAESSTDLTADTHQEYLLKLLQAEVKHRENARRNKLMNLAGFYYRKSFDGFHFDEVTLPDAVSQVYLQNCEFIKTKTYHPSKRIHIFPDCHPLQTNLRSTMRDLESWVKGNAER